MARGKVVLSGMSFYGYHGYYSEENKLGNHYTVDLQVTTNLEPVNDELEGTINYEKLYKLTEAVMIKPYKLLETLAYRVADNIFNSFKGAEVVHIIIKKKQPPIGAICDYAAVEFELDRKDIS